MWEASVLIGGEIWDLSAVYTSGIRASDLQEARTPDYPDLCLSQNFAISPKKLGRILPDFALKSSDWDRPRSKSAQKARTEGRPRVYYPNFSPRTPAGVLDVCGG